jgi:Galactose-3-O-sulfotransferase
MRHGVVLMYLHIPKTAGTSLTDIIYDQYSDSSGSCEEAGMFREGVYYYPGEPGFVRPCKAEQVYRINQPSTISNAMRRSELRVVAGHFSFGLHMLIDRRTTYVTMLRHPVERIVSLYFHLKRWPSHGDNKPWLERVGLRPLHETSLDEFIQNYPLCELDNDQTRRVAGEDPEFGHCTLSLLQKAKSNIERHFCLVGVAERFQETLRVAADVLGWSADGRNYKKLRNEYRSSTSLVPSKTQELILKQNALDIELYSFANDWLTDRLRTIAT